MRVWLGLCCLLIGGCSFLLEDDDEPTEADAAPIDATVFAPPTPRLLVEIVGETENVNMRGVAVLGDSIIVTGNAIGGVVYFGPHTRDLGAAQRAFVASFDADGTLEWLQTIGQAPANTAAQELAVAGGLVYIAGRFTGSVDFLGQGATIADQVDGFVLALDGSGAPQWVEILAGPGVVQPNAIDASSGHLVAGGQFDTSVTVGPDSYDTAGDDDPMLLSLTRAPPSFRFSANPLPTVAREIVSGVGVKEGRDDVFMAVVHPEPPRSSFIHHFTQGTLDGTIDLTGDIGADRLAIAGERGCFAGRFEGIAMIGTRQLTALVGSDSFAACAVDNGDVVWAAPMAGLGTVDADAIDGTADLLVVGGDFDGELEIGTLRVTSNANSDAFVAAFDPAVGTPLWALAFGAAGDQAATDFAIASDRILMVGESIVSGAPLSGFVVALELE